MALLYLEDFVSAIEQLPQDIKQSYTAIRTLDLKVQNTLDSAEEKRAALFLTAPKMTAEERQRKFVEFQAEQAKAKELAAEKVQIATQTSDLIGRLLRHLDGELQKFGDELESSNQGITQQLEQRSLALDHEDRPGTPEDVYRKPRYHPYSSSEADYDDGTPSRRQRGINRRKQSSLVPMEAEVPAATPYAQATPQVTLTIPAAALAAAQASGEDNLYCTCRQVSYGEMVGCDNDTCPIEWFHYACVGITEPPKGKWYCPICRGTQRR